MFTCFIDISNMEWNNHQVIELIQAIEARPVLWKPSHPDYKNKLKKKQEIQAVAEIVNCAENEVERKWNVIKVQLRREIHKSKSYSKLGESGGEDLEQRIVWFAFPYLSFMCHRDFPKTISTTVPMKKPFENFWLDNDRDDYLQAQMCNEYDRRSSGSDNFNDFKTPNLKRKLHHIDPRFTESVRMHNDKKPIRIRDNVDIFGEGVASKIKQIKDERVRLTVQRDIDNLIYDALIGVGKYLITPSSSANTNSSYILGSNTTISDQDIHSPSAITTSAYISDENITSSHNSGRVKSEPQELDFQTN